MPIIKKYKFLFLFVLVLLAVVGIAYKVIRSSKNPSNVQILGLTATATPDTRPTPTPTAQPTQKLQRLEPIIPSVSTTTQAVMLPLTIVPSTQGTGWEGNGPTPTPIPVPKTVTVQIPTLYRNSFSAFAMFAYNQLFPIMLAPKGWSGSGSVGANGNAGVAINRDADKKGDSPYVVYREVPACNSCFYHAAALLFSSIMQDAKKDPAWAPLLVPEPIPGLQTKELSQNVVSYSYPLTNGLEIYGIASVGINQNHLTMPFKQFEVGFPSGERDIATTLLNFYYQRYFLK